MIVEKDTIDFMIKKLTELKIQTAFEERKRGKKRWVRKTTAYQDLINLLEEVNNGIMD